MAPKTKKARIDQASSSKKSSRADAIKARFEDLKSISLIPERGFDAGDLKVQDIEDLISPRQWTEFFRHTGKGCTTFVREFYASAPFCPLDKVRVRKWKVDASASAINQFYGLPDIPLEVCSFHQMRLSPDTDYDSILQAVCTDPRTDWTRDRKGNILHVPKSALTLVNQLLFRFISSRLLPSSHLQEVSKERVLLLFCILKMEHINFGEIIVEGIRKINGQTPPASLWFPWLISSLVVEAGGRSEVTDETFSKPQALNYSKNRVPRPPRPQEPENTNSGDEDVPDPNLAPALLAIEAPVPDLPHSGPSSSDPAAARHEEIMAYLQNLRREFQEGQQSLQRQIQELANSFQAHMEIRDPPPPPETH